MLTSHFWFNRKKDVSSPLQSSRHGACSADTYDVHGWAFSSFFTSVIRHFTWKRRCIKKFYSVVSCQSNGKTRKSLKSPQQNISLLHLFSLVIAAHGDNFQKCLTLLLSGEIMVHSWRVLSTDAWLYWSGHVFMVIIGHIGCRKSTPPTNFKSEVSGIQLVMHLAVIEYFTAKFLAAQQQKLEKI